MAEPTVDQVRLAFADAGTTFSWSRGERADGFDRWLAEHDREVAEKAWDAGSVAIDKSWRAIYPRGKKWPGITPNPHRLSDDAAPGGES